MSVFNLKCGKTVVVTWIDHIETFNSGGNTKAKILPRDDRNEIPLIVDWSDEDAQNASDLGILISKINF